jgi:hypothetical protein
MSPDYIRFTVNHAETPICIGLFGRLTDSAEPWQVDSVVANCFLITNNKHKLGGIT